VENKVKEGRTTETALRAVDAGRVVPTRGRVGAGVGMAMLPKSVVERSSRRDDIRIHTLPRRISRVETLFITRLKAVHSSALERLVDVIKKQNR